MQQLCDEVGSRACPLKPGRTNQRSCTPSHSQAPQQAECKTAMVTEAPSEGREKQTCACVGGAGDVPASIGRPGVPAAAGLCGTPRSLGVQQPLHPRRESRVARPVAARIMRIGAFLQYEQRVQRACAPS